jgi:MoaA/NifB/PqqE/SkfB family radical SAM enzyme
MFSYDRERIINEERIKRLVSWYEGKKVGPFQIDIELHKRCNLRCLFCARYEEHEKLNRESKKYELPKEKWIEVIEEAKEIDAVVINIEGINEPSLVPEIFFPVIKKAKEVGMYGIVTTNGTTWNEEQLKNLVEISWDRIHFSIHSSKPEVHDKLTQKKGSFRKAIKNIKILNKWKRKLKSERPMLNINVCVNRLNFKELPKIVELAHKLKADYFFTEPLMVYSPFQERLKIKEEETKELEKIVEKAGYLARKYGIDNNFATEDKNLKKEIVESASKMKPLLIKEVKNLNINFISAPCFKPWTQMAIRFDGSVSFCGYAEVKENVKNKSLKEIWFGKIFEDARNRMLKKVLYSHCNKCVPSDFTQRVRFRKELIQALSEKYGGNNK